MDFIYHSAADQGLRGPQGTVPQRGRRHRVRASAARVDGKLRLEHTIFGEDFRALRSLTSTATPKLTIPAPSMVHYRRGRAAIDPDVYPSIETSGATQRRPTRSRSSAWASSAASYLQFDDTSLACLNDPVQRAEFAARGDDAEHQYESYIRQINAALVDRPAGMTVTTHMCRGNFRSSWVAEGGYGFVAEAVFNELAPSWNGTTRARRLRAAALRPQGKTVVLGLVTSKRGDWKPRTNSSAASRRPAATSTSTSSVSPHNAFLLDGRGQQPRP